MADLLRYPIGTPQLAADPDPTMPVLTELQTRRSPSLFSPPPSVPANPDIVPTSLWRQVQSNEAQRSAGLLAVHMDTSALAHNFNVEGTRQQAVNQIPPPRTLLQDTYQTSNLLLSAITTDNFDVEMMKYRERMKLSDAQKTHDIPIIQQWLSQAHNRDEQAFYSSTDKNAKQPPLPGSDVPVLATNADPLHPVVQSEGYKLATDGKEFVKALTVNTVAGVRALSEGQDIGSARTQAGADFESMWFNMPRPVQLGLEQVNPVNIAFMATGAEAASAVRGMGFRGSGLLASFFDNPVSQVGFKVGSQYTWEKTDGLYLPLRVAVSGGAGLLAASPGSVIRNSGKALAGIDQFLGEAPAGYMGPAGADVLNAGIPWLRPIASRGGHIIPPTFTNPAIVVPPKAATELFDMKPFQAGLSAGESVANVIRRTIPGLRYKWFEDNMYSTPVMHEVDRVTRNIDVQATTVSHSIDARIRGAFETDESGRITALAGKVAEHPDAPTFSELAANYPLFQPHMTAQQVQATEAVRDQLKPIGDLYGSLGHKADNAGDIIDGGFYFPRGRTNPSGFVAEPRVSAGEVGGGGRATAERTRAFASQSEALAAGYTYEQPRAAVARYVSEVGSRALESHTSNYFKSLIDPNTGKAMAQTAADRIPVALRNQVEVLRAKIQGRNQTLLRRAGALGVANRNAATATRAGEAALDRAVGAEQRVNDIGYDPNDIQAARAAVSQTIVEGRQVAYDAGRNLELTRQANGVLTRTERDLQRQVDDLHDELARADMYQQGYEQAGTATEGLTGESATARGVLDAHQNVIDGIQAKLDAITDRAARQGEKVDDLITKGEVLGDLSDANRGETVASRQYERAQYEHDRQFSAAKRQLTVLERELNRRGREAARAGEIAGTAATRHASTISEVTSFRDELNGLSEEWRNAKSAAQSAGRDRSRINLPGMQAYDFPVSVANVVNAWAKTQQRNAPQWAQWAMNFNQIYRGMRATLDDSYMGVQGWLGAADDPRAAADAWKMNIHAFNNEQALGEFINKFDDGESAAGRLTASQWARVGASVQAGAGEFSLEGSALENVTVMGRQPIRATNRAFGYTGSAQRLRMLSHDLEDEMRRTGRTAQELLDDGTAEHLAKTVNRVTGVSTWRAGGEAGDIALFASRYLASRFETAVRGVAGIGQELGSAATLGVIPRASIENKYAARAIGRLITTGTIVTVMANEMLGNETDFRPVVNGRYNTNFMRIRALGRDWSMFGTWDSLLGAVVNTALGKPQDAYRGLASGPVTMAWDLLSGHDAVGNITRPQSLQQLRNDPLTLFKLVGTVGSTFVPFSGGGLATSAGDFAKAIGNGEVMGAGGAVVGAAADVTGIKAPALSPSEQLDEARSTTIRSAKLTNPIDGTALHANSVKDLAAQVGTTLARSMADSVDADGKIGPLKLEHIDRLREAAGNGDRSAAAQLVGIDTRARLTALADGMKVNGVLDGAKYRDARAAIINQQIGASDAYRSEMQNFSASGNEIDRNVAEWYGLIDQAKVPGTGLVDYQLFNGLEDQFLNRIGPDMAAKVQANVSVSPQGSGEAEVDLRNVRDQLNKGGLFTMDDAAWQRVQTAVANVKPNTKDDATNNYIEAMKAAPNATEGRRISLAFYADKYTKAGIDPELALQKAQADIGTEDAFLSTYASVKNALSIQWATKNKQLVAPAVKWGYLPPTSDYIGLGQKPRAERLKDDFLTGKSYGQLAISYGLTRGAVEQSLRSSFNGSPAAAREKHAGESQIG